MTKLVIFRLETTLLQGSRHWGNAILRVLAEYGVTIHPALADATQGLPTELALRMLTNWTPGQWAPAYRDLERLLVASYSHCVHSPEVFGASRCLQALQADGVLVALESGFTRPVLDVVLERMGWAGRGFIDALVPCSDALAPVGESIERAMELTGVLDPMMVAHIGRSAFDVHAAAEVGVRVRALVGDRLAFEGLPYTHLIESAGLVPELLRRTHRARESGIVHNFSTGFGTKYTDSAHALQG